MSIEYMFPNGKSIHYNSFLDSLPDFIVSTDKDAIDLLDKHLSVFNGKMISVKAWQNSIGILGIEFLTEEDLLYFKLKFN